MKNHELLDMIGDVNEEYVLEAEDSAARPRPRWRTWAAAAACAALALCAYPAWRAFQPQPPAPDPAAGQTQAPGPVLVQRPGLHPYTLLEEGRHIVTTEGDLKAPAGGGGQDAPVPAPDQPPRGNGPDLPGGATIGSELPQSPEGDGIDVPGQDAPVQETGDAQYRDLYSLYESVGPGDPMNQWFGGCWIDRSGGLTVAIVEGWRNQAMEDQVRALAGWDDIVFVDAAYPQRFLDGLMDGISQTLKALDCHISSVYGVNMMENRLDLDFFGVPSDEVLAALAELDPAGDAIRVQVFADGHLSFTDKEVVKGPAPVEPGTEDPEPATIDDEPFPTPIVENAPVPGGVTQPGAAQDSGAREESRPAWTVADGEWDIPADEPGPEPTPGPDGALP